MVLCSKSTNESTKEANFLFCSGFVWSPFLDFYSCLTFFFFNFFITWKLTFCFQESIESWQIQNLPHNVGWKLQVINPKQQDCCSEGTKLALDPVPPTPYIHGPPASLLLVIFQSSRKDSTSPYLCPTYLCTLWIFHIIGQQNFLKFQKWGTKRRGMNSITYPMCITTEKIFFQWSLKTI